MTEHTHREPWYRRGVYTHNHSTQNYPYPTHIHPHEALTDSVSDPMAPVRDQIENTVWLQLATYTHDDPFLITDRERVYRIRNHRDEVIGWIKRVRQSTDTPVGHRQSRIRRPGKGRNAWVWRSVHDRAFPNPAIGKETRQLAVDAMIREMNRR